MRQQWLKWQTFILECENLAEKLFFTRRESEKITGDDGYEEQKNCKS